MNTVLATDAESWKNYVAARQQAPESIALLPAGTPAMASAVAGSPQRLGGVLPIVPLHSQGRGFALHPQLGTVQSLFQQQRLAVVANVGPLLLPTSKAQYLLPRHPRPPQLFSHNDQQNAWQAFQPEGAQVGWGGRMGDLLAANNGVSALTAISTAGNAVWLSGNAVRQYQMGTTGPVRLGSDATGRLFGSLEVAAALQRVVSGTRSGHAMEADLAAVARRSIDVEQRLRGTLKAAIDAPFGTAPASGSYNQATDPRLMYGNPLTGQAAANNLAQQLQMVARMVDAGPGLGMRRQVFFVNLGGFDTHDQQNRNHADLMARLDHGLAYFDATLGALGLRQQVTTFTASDFGRSFTSNGDGTDHGWGGHHVVMGGAVHGGDVYGRFPVLGSRNAANNGFDSSPDQLSNGVLLPAISVDQYGATLAQWFGMARGALGDVFPHLNQFNASAHDLGFMGG